MLPGIKQFELTDRVAIITGGSKGLGEAMGAGLASAGANLMLVSRNEEEAQATAEKLASEYNCQAIGFAADVSKQSDTEAMAAKCLEQFGRIDILINSAGINIRGPIDEVSYEEFAEVQRINVDGTWLACRAVLPHMKEKQYGRIINLASALGLVAIANRTPYCSSKGGAVMLTRSLALELAREASLISTPMPQAPGYSSSNVKIRHPVPVPKSNIFRF